MTVIKLKLENQFDENSMVSFLNDHIDAIRKGFDIDMSHLLEGTVSETPRVTNVTYVSENKIRVEYQFHWYIHNLCLNIKDENIEKRSFVAEVQNGILNINEAISSSGRSTVDEF